ncbi:MAG: aminotransferase class V-fold PLP-dependent enzyme [candidate division Zixibacteria bacterium]|nr:aminotransferase class V-fold PLP-dependent enzyme [candidate division Zixibacteria bacterium]
MLNVRKDFPALFQNNPKNGKPPIYLDSATMSLRPQNVVNSVVEYYEKFPACSGRGRSAHWFAEEVNVRIDKARENIRKFINAKSPDEIVFCKNTTEGLNLVAQAFSFKKGDAVLISNKEHNSNLCPWQELKRKGIIEYQVVERGNAFDLDRFKKALSNERIKLVSMAHTSNLDGYTLPAKEIVSLCHNRPQGYVYVMFDGAQSVSHMPVDVQKLDVDFLAFSVHKMCGPSGVGVLYLKKELYPVLGSFITGGGTIRKTHYYELPEYWEGTPTKYEAGLQNYAGIIGAGSAVEYLTTDERIRKLPAHEYELNKVLTDALIEYHQSGIIEILGPLEPQERAGILTFEAETAVLNEITEKCLASNVMFRTGNFCVDSFCELRKRTGRIRLSIYLYNNIEDCNMFLEIAKPVLESQHPTKS